MKTVKDGNTYKVVKQVERKYWKREETEQPWTQPVLSANGTIGGDSFACAANTEYTDNPAWKAFDNDTNTAWEGVNGFEFPQIIEWYNPNPLKITQIVFVTGYKRLGQGVYYCVKNYKIQASTDGNSWVDVFTGTNSSYSDKKSITVSISNNNFYKYWRLSVSSVNKGNFVDIWSMAITATQLDETITPATAEDYDFYTDENIYKCWGNAPETIFESSTGGSYSVNIPAQGRYEITCVGGGGAAAMRGVYDDKGYGWGGGSGGAFKGIFELNAGSYTVVVGSANNNTTAQSGNTQTLNPTDTTTHDSYVQGVVTCGGGGSGHYNTSYVGEAGAAPTFSIMPESTTINSAGNAGLYNSGGKGSAAAAVCAGGASVYLDYGRGQGCRTSEYASKRSWINGTNGYVRIRRMY